MLYVNYISVKLEKYKSQNIDTHHTHTHKERKERSAHHRALEVDLFSNTCVIALSLNFFNPKMEITSTS